MISHRRSALRFSRCARGFLYCTWRFSRCTRTERCARPRPRGELGFPALLAGAGNRAVPTRRDVVARAGLALIASAGFARAQGAYPDRSIRVLVGYPAGGGVDIVARMLGEPIKAALGQSVIVENRTGASA